jgi:hypothetical protein
MMENMNELTLQGVRTRIVPGFDKYRVGDDGSTWSLVRGEWRPLRQYVKHRGYRGVLLTCHGLRINCYVHTLVLLAFVGPKQLKQECRHLDGNTANNVLSNLAWGTSAENKRDRVTHGTHLYGESHGRAKLTDDQVKDVRRLYETGEWTKASLAKTFGISESQIRRIVNMMQRA